MYRIAIALIFTILIFGSACTVPTIRVTPAEQAAYEATVTARAATPLPVPALPTVTPDVTPCVVKGNDARDGRKLYHLPGTANYNQVVPEMCFDTEQEAIDAGYTKAGR